MTTLSPWKKSSFSGGGEGNDCVEIADFPNGVAIRDSKGPAYGMLTFSPGAFASFLNTLKPPPRSQRGSRRRAVR
ncbi:DUF397 domain-containing protein [Streptomyces flavalbus]|uniref:DUF397 domain-containing protein n=1 Tax=Streptomyces flavalbus TaxID=2665155 RepID=A0ABW2W8L6_9ACTN